MPQRWQGWMVVGLLLGTSAAAIAEEITLTTYYPSPRGVYDQLRVRTLQDFDDLAYYVDPAGDPTGISAVLAGRVGIGTTTPTQRFEVFGGNIKLGSPLGVGAESRIVLQDENDYIFKLDQSATTPERIGIVMNLNEVLSISQAGNVGIGTATPTAKLHIVQTAAGQPALKIDDQSGDTTPFYISDTGNVGIGTTTPALKLDVNGEAIVGSTADQTPSLNIRGGTVEGGQVILNTLGDGASGERPDSWTLDNDATGYFRIFYGSVSFGTAVDAVRITPTGDVGIGTGTPTARLDIREGVNRILFQLMDSLQNTGLTLFDREPAVNAYNTYIDFRSGPDSRTEQGRIWYVNNPLYDPGLGLFARYTLGSGGYTPDVHISTATGNVGIGTTDPPWRLTVNSPAPPPGGADGIVIEGPEAPALAIWGTGGVSPIELAELGGATAAGAFSSGSQPNDAVLRSPFGRLILATGTSGTNSYPRLTITNDGNVGIGTMAPTRALEVIGGGGIYTDNDVCTNVACLNTASDVALKKNIAPFTGALEKVLQLEPVTFEWKAPDKELHRESGLQFGLIAQQVEEVLPQWVTTNAEGVKYLTSRGFEGLFAEAIKELKDADDKTLQRLDAVIEQQQKEIETLKRRNDDLNQVNEAIERRLSLLEAQRSN
ncbi:MAG: tail fiber domain-containing protein [Candidatus Omnitrophica bacterium]|nr:tail fiber domain-containing protein [Candidatus Omnitrophota bacterium]